MNINQALPCALIVNKLVTNSFKYAFENNQDGNLDVRFKSNGEGINIMVNDNGPGLPKNYEKMVEESLGHRLVSQLVKQLDAKIDVETSKDEGTRYKISFEKKRKSGSASHYFI